MWWLPGSPRDKLASRTPGALPRKPLYHLKPQADAVVILWVDIHDYTRQIFTSILQGKKERKSTLSISFILWPDLLSHSSSFLRTVFSVQFSVQFLRCLLIKVKGKENSAGPSLPAHRVFCQKSGKHLVLPCSHWVAHRHPVCLPWVPLTHPLLSTSPSPLPEPLLPALMARRDVGPHSLQPFHAAPPATSSLSGASSQFLNNVVCFFLSQMGNENSLHYNL